MHWFWIVLLVIALVVAHVFVSVLARNTTREVRMENAERTKKNLSKALNPKLLLISLTNTMWAVGTSAAAGALSA